MTAEPETPRVETRPYSHTGDHSVLADWAKRSFVQDEEKLIYLTPIFWDSENAVFAFAGHQDIAAGFLQIFDEGAGVYGLISNPSLDSTARALGLSAVVENLCALARSKGSKPMLMEAMSVRDRELLREFIVPRASWRRVLK